MKNLFSWRCLFVCSRNLCLTLGQRAPSVIVSHDGRFDIQTQMTVIFVLNFGARIPRFGDTSRFHLMTRRTHVMVRGGRYCDGAAAFGGEAWSAPKITAAHAKTHTTVTNPACPCRCCRLARQPSDRKNPNSRN